MVTQLAEATATDSFGMLAGVVAAGGVLVLSGAGLSTEFWHPGLPRADRPGPARHADDLPDLYRECFRQAQVLGP